MGVNWIAAYNRLFILLDREGPTYHSGPNFLRMAQQIDPGVPHYKQLMDLRQRSGLSTSRRDFYWDVIRDLPDQQKYTLFRAFIDALEPHAREEIAAIRALVFGGGSAVPTTVVPADLWSSEKLNLGLQEIDRAIDAQQFNRAVTLAYTCMEGLYKTYVRKHVPTSAGVTDIIPLSRIVKDDIAGKLRVHGAFPEQIVNSIPTITNAVANSRNGFSESHFSDDSQKWLALFARDLVNSVGRLLLHFI